MSDTGLYFVMQSSLSSQKLSAFYDFIYDSSENNVEGHSANFTGIQTNSIFCNDPPLHTGFILGALGSNESETSYDVSEILEGDKLDLTSGNFKVPLDGLNANNISVIIDFEFEGAID